MSSGEASLGDLRDALVHITRRLDELAASVARLQPAPAPASGAGEPLGESERRTLGRIKSLLAVQPSLGRAEALFLALDRVIHEAGADCAALFTPGRGDGLEAVARRGFAAGELRVRLDEGIVGRAFVERDAIQGGLAHHASDRLLREHGLGSALALPVRAADGGVLGVLLAGRRRPAAFAGQALETLVLVADRAALVLGVGAPGAAASGWATTLLGQDLDLGRVAAAVAQEAAVRLGAARVAVLLPDEGGLTLAAGVGLPEGAVPPDPSAGGVAVAVQTGEPWLASPAGGDAALAAFLGAPPRVVVPLVAGDRMVAVLVAGGSGAVSLQALADLRAPASAALRNARLHAETLAALSELRAQERRPAAAPLPPVRDFASLLAILLARLTLIRERVRDAAVEGDLAVAEEVAWRAAEAVRGLLGFAPGRRDRPLAPLDLAGVLRAAIDTAGRRWAARGAPRPTVTLELEPLPPVRGDADDLREALEHLLENAAEAQPAGGAVTVRARWDGGGRVAVVVEDAGAGMDDEVRARALEPFFTTKGPGRLGLGLSLTQAIVARHHGALELGSVPGHGTTVRLGLPTAHSLPAGAAPDVARVLVVEDEASVRAALVALLERHGYMPLPAADGREALGIVQRQRVDAVLTDLTVAPVSGFEVARTVKRIRPGTPVILITGWPGRLDPAVVQASGIDRIIEKPAGEAEVLGALDAALTQRRARGS
ncbi:MAG TPA: ATP-binding protein [Methylomirabilota bacterium]|jgi:signal transduction histidine kinase/ActR/RegA family two-component response regulator|nr:ATP-binding protein [Methylomirabilota bacterium]